MLKIKSLAYTLRINQSGSWKVQRRNYHHQNNQNRRTNPLLLCRFYSMCRADMTFAVDWVLHNQLSVRLTHFRSYTMYSADNYDFCCWLDVKKRRKKKRVYVRLTHFRSCTMCRGDNCDLCCWLGVKKTTVCRSHTFLVLLYVSRWALESQLSDCLTHFLEN